MKNIFLYSMALTSLQAPFAWANSGNDPISLEPVRIIKSPSSKNISTATIHQDKELSGLYSASGDVVTIHSMCGPEERIAIATSLIGRSDPIHRLVIASSPTKSHKRMLKLGEAKAWISFFKAHNEVTSLFMRDLRLSCKASHAFFNFIAHNTKLQDLAWLADTKAQSYSGLGSNLQYMVHLQSLTISKHKRPFNMIDLIKFIPELRMTLNLHHLAINGHDLGADDIKNLIISLSSHTKLKTLGLSPAYKANAYLEDYTRDIGILQHLEQWQNYRLKHGVSPATINLSRPGR